MANPTYLFFGIMILVLSIGVVSSLIFYSAFTRSRKDIFAKVIQAETEFVSDILEFDISDLNQTNVGKELLEIVFKEQPAIFPSLIMKTIDQGESNSLEFKSTFQWNLRTKELDKEVLLEVLRSIAAFMNTEGGILLIGVDDSGKITGIGKDLEAFGKDPQGIQQELHKIFANYLSGVQRFPDIKIVNIDNEPLLVITIIRSSTPVYLEIEDKKEFYIRATNHTRRLTNDEVYSYSLTHFFQFDRA